MTGKILVVVFAFIAGAGGAFAYELANESFMQSGRAVEDSRISELEAMLDAATCRIEELDSARQADSQENEVLVARLNTLAQEFSDYREKQGELALAKEQNDSKQADTDRAVEDSTGGSGSASPTGGRISGQDLMAALQDLPDEGREMIRKAIYNEVKRVRNEQEAVRDPRKRLGLEAGKAIKKLAQAVALTPVQIEQAKEIASRHIERAVEAARVAKERNDPGYALNAEKEIKAEAEQDVIEILTPEQLDKLREMDPEGIGKRYPRGF